jgi:hypothetical protein
MNLFLTSVGIFFSALFSVMEFLMLVDPAKYPNRYVGFLRESAIRRETTEQGKWLAILIQGLLALAFGTFIAPIICIVLRVTISNLRRSF